MGTQATPPTAATSMPTSAEPSQLSNQPTTLVRSSVSPIPTSVDAMGIPAQRADRDEFTSPAPPASSITPPPSSQVPSHHRGAVRTPTPSTPHLSSPPPSTRALSHPGHAVEPESIVFTDDQVAEASPEELRAMVNQLANELQEARMSAAHHKLQYNMLCLDSTESQNRMIVELGMAQKEIEVLQNTLEERQHGTPTQPIQQTPEPTVNPANAILIHELNRHCQSLQHDNAMLHDLLNKARSDYEARDGELKGLMEQNQRLRGRIRLNREHFDAMFEPQGGSPRHSRSLMGTPVTPRNRVTGRHPISGSENRRDQQPFEALLLADKVLSQETATAPSTPTKSAPRHRFGHTRGTHSLSSLPSTPNRSRAQPVNAPLLATPLNYSQTNRVPAAAQSSHHHNVHSRGRRDSSASTITASSVDNAYSGDEIPESQASRAASSLLRKTPQPKSSSFESIHKNSGLVQGKIFGQVKKPGVQRSAESEKRRLSGRDPVVGSPSKKGRFQESVGLGIGAVANSTK